MSDKKPYCIILEGTNFSGKTSGGEIIKKLLPSSLVIEQHDFFQKDIFFSTKGREWPSSQKDYRELEPNTINSSQSYVDNREAQIWQFIEQNHNDGFIVERLILTRLVYSQLLFNTKPSHKEWNLYSNTSHNILLIYFNCSAETILKRLEKAASRTDKRLVQPPEHLFSKNQTLKKLKLYNRFYNFLNVPKVNIDTSDFESEYHAHLEKIITNLLEENSFL